jgi:regulatory protein
MGPHLNTDMPAGTITALMVQQHEPTRVSVFLDGAFAFGVLQELVRQWDLWVGRQLSAEDQAHLSAAEQLLTAQATARQYLAARPRTAHEVRQEAAPERGTGPESGPGHHAPPEPRCPR